MTLADFNVDEYNLILDTAREMKNIINRDIKKVPTLRGKAVINLFFEASTRTRTSFELAGKYLGADVVNITTSTSSVTKGESLRDTILTVEAMNVDAIVMRHPVEGAAHFAAGIAKPVIINAGDGAHAHPSQGLLDMFTIKAHKGTFSGLKVAILGDILELGEFSEEIHRKIGKFINESKIDFVITAGVNSQFINDEIISIDNVHFNNAEEVVANLDNLLQDGDSILVKASNGMEFNLIANKLRENVE